MFNLAPVNGTRGHLYKLAYAHENVDGSFPSVLFPASNPKVKFSVGSYRDVSDIRSAQASIGR